jgi:hypothetical protein
MDVTEPVEGDAADDAPLRLSERVARAARETEGPRIILHDDGTTEIEIDVYAITYAALPRPEPHVGVMKRISRRLSGKHESAGTVRYVTRRP